jgi:septal ring-binding cell division protein DamX
MMRKLAVTVFVVSLAALGCGSDNGTPTRTDTGVTPDGSKPTDVANKDVASGPDTAINPDLGPDVAQGGSEAGTQIEVPVVTGEVGRSEANPAIDAGKDLGKDGTSIDQQPTQLDGGTDAGSRIDSGASVDGGAVDGGAQG